MRWSRASSLSSGSLVVVPVMSAFVSVSVVSPVVSAQDASPVDAPPPADAPPSDLPSEGTEQAPPQGGTSAGQPSQPQIFIPGYPAPGTRLEGHLPSSSRASTDTTRSADGFDLDPRGSGSRSVRGGAGGSFVLEGQYVPEAHTVRRGDTLWDISNRYYQNPYGWPRLWAQNPQILNPHWIYPGDRLRLREEGDPRRSQDRILGRKRQVPPKTVFLRESGWVDDVAKDTWGKVVGSPEDQMLLSEGDDIYAQIEGDHPVSVGQELTIFRPLRDVKDKDDGAKGQLVAVRGTARVDRYNPKTRMVKARIIESLDIIERGEKLGPVTRRFDVVAPVASGVDVEARILASVDPLQIYGNHHLVFLDKGEKDGVKVGQRFFAVRRGDRWQQSLRTAGKSATQRPRMQDDSPAKVEDLETDVPTDKLPDETYAELRVIRVREGTSAALVIQAKHEIERGARLISRKGF
ncbi:MAG TPA: LysM domain-containing protein [Polyangiaceae bacterium]|nr:LysM domain-containing protein [Polyangiaceae bacterium]